MFACLVLKSGVAPQSCDSLCAFAVAFSPRIEQIAADAVLLDIEGLEHLFGSPHSLAETVAVRAAENGLPLQIAIASTSNAALYAARGFPGITVIEPGDEARTLSALPLTLLSTPPEMQQTLSLWGLRTFGDFAALPVSGIAERFGTEGIHLHRAARGEPGQALLPLLPDPEFEVAQELDYPLELLEPLSFILGSLINRLCAGLQARGKAVGRLHLQLKLDSILSTEAAEKSYDNISLLFERSISLPVPLIDTSALLKLLRLDLEAHPPQAPILAVRLRAEPAPPRVTQNDLFQPAAPEPARLEVCLARITKLVGAGNVGSPELIDTHRPDAVDVRPFRIADGKRLVRNFVKKLFRRAGTVATNADGSALLACRIFRPPVRTDVECSAGRPATVRIRMERRKVVSCAGPWLTSGDWWTADPWQREEWDVELASQREAKWTDGMPNAFARQRFAGSPGTLYRIYRELQTKVWYVDAAYD